VYYENGTDFTAQLVKLGYARVYTEGEFDKEDYYVELQQQAIENRTGLWGYESYKTQSRKIEILTVHYDAAGEADDRTDLNDEYVVIKNYGSVDVSLDGWKIMDEGGHTYHFHNVVIPAGGKITLHTGSGVDTSKDLYWNWHSPIWNNRGDTAYLYDGSGELVDSYSW